VNQHFRVRVARPGDHQIDVSREPWFCSGGHGKAANQGKGDVDVSEIGLDPA
jgi:hypothetical protein